MSGFLGALVGGAVQARGAMLRGQAEGEELTRQRAREERLHRAQEAAAALTQQRFDYERSRDALQDDRQRERDGLDRSVRLGELATRGVFPGALPPDPKEPGRYTDLGGGMYYDGHYSPEFRAQLEGASRLAASVARRNATRETRPGAPEHFTGANGTPTARRMSPAQAETARGKFADRALEAAGGDVQRAMAMMEGSPGDKARAGTLGMTRYDYGAAGQRYTDAHTPRPTEKGRQAQQLRDYLRAKAQLRGQGKGDAEIRATLGPPPI